jgi:hypothetical protein
MSSHIPAEDVVLEFTYDDGDDATVTVSGMRKGVTALRALIEAGDESNLDKIQASIDAGEIQDETDIEIEFSSGDDTCTVTVSGSEETFLELLDVMAADGDDSIQELYDEDDK